MALGLGQVISDFVVCVDFHAQLDRFLSYTAADTHCRKFPSDNSHLAIPHMWYMENAELILIDYA